MLAMMMLNTCIESYGAAVHVIDSMLASGLQVRPAPHLPATDVTVAPTVPGPHIGENFAGQVQSAVAVMDHRGAQAVWLVDVCGCSYQQAAFEARVERSVIADRVAQGRQAIRSQLTSV